MKNYIHLWNNYQEKKLDFYKKILNHLLLKSKNKKTNKTLQKSINHKYNIKNMTFNPII